MYCELLIWINLLNVGIEDEEDDSMGDVEKFVLGLQNIEN